MVLRSQSPTEPTNKTNFSTEENIDGLFFKSRRNELYQDDDQNYSDINGLSASSVSLMDPDNVAKLLAERNMHVDTIKTTQTKEKYKGELIKGYATRVQKEIQRLMARKNRATESIGKGFNLNPDAQITSLDQKMARDNKERNEAKTDYSKMSTEELNRLYMESK